MFAIQPIVGVKKTLLTEDILTFMFYLLEQFDDIENQITWVNIL